MSAGADPAAIPASILSRLAGTLGRGADAPLVRPPGIVLGLDARPPLPQLAALAAQQVLVQSIYFVLPGLVAVGFGADAAAAANFLCLSLLGVALFALLQALTRGMVGAGYAIPSIPSPVLLGAYLLAAQAGADLAEAAALTVVTGVAALVTVPLFRRLSALIPTEVAGVVVFLIGASLLPLVLTIMRLDPAAPLQHLPTTAVTLGTLALIALVAILGRVRIAPFAVMTGMLAGTAIAVLSGMLARDAGAQLAAADWFALPRPIMPSFDPAAASLAGVFLLSLVPLHASLLGNLIAFQRAANEGWRRPDPPPLRRGLLAQALAVIATGGIGGMAPAVSTAAVGLSIATGTLARRIALAGAAALVVLAFCPKLVMLFVLVPDPVKAAMLLYVAGFMMAQGARMLAARMLDARRTVVTGLGLSAGLAVLIEPAFFAVAVPALAAPLSFGSLVAFALNLLTLPLVARRARFTLPIGDGAARADTLEREWDRLGRAWGLRRETADRARHALIELGDLLAGRGVAVAAVQAWMQEDRLEVTLAFAGPPLPAPAARAPRAAALLEDSGPAAMEGFGVWLATRHAARHTQRSGAEGVEFLLEFED